MALFIEVTDLEGRSVVLPRDKIILADASKVNKEDSTPTIDVIGHDVIIGINEEEHARVKEILLEYSL